MTNLLQETIDAIKRSGNRVKDIVFIGSERSGYCCTWRQFRKMADVEYGPGFDYIYVAWDLTIVFGNGYKLFRGDYDWAKSSWAESIPFQPPKKSLPIKHLLAGKRPYEGCYTTLKELNGGLR